MKVYFISTNNKSGDTDKEISINIWLSIGTRKSIVYILICFTKRAQSFFNILLK